jgi:hypothetical protein
MSSRWPQGQQEQRSPYATYDDAWPEENDGAQPWPDVSWQDPEPGDQGQWATSAAGEPWGPQREEYPGQPHAAADRPSAATQPSGHAGDYQQEWNQGAGGLGDDADYEWFQYLSQGRSAPSSPDAPPAPPRGAPKSGRR